MSTPYLPTLKQRRKELRLTLLFKIAEGNGAFFDFFPYMTPVFFLFQATGHSFSSRNVIFGLREPCTIRN